MIEEVSEELSEEVSEGGRKAGRQAGRKENIISDKKQNTKLQINKVSFKN